MGHLNEITTLLIIILKFLRVYIIEKSKIIERIFDQLFKFYTFLQIPCKWPIVYKKIFLLRSSLVRVRFFFNWQKFVKIKYKVQKLTQFEKIVVVGYQSGRMDTRKFWRR